MTGKSSRRKPTAFTKKEAEKMFKALTSHFEEHFLELKAMVSIIHCDMTKEGSMYRGYGEMTTERIKDRVKSQKDRIKSAKLKKP